MGTHLAFEYWVGQTHCGPFMTNIGWAYGPQGPPGPPYGAPMILISDKCGLMHFGYNNEKHVSWEAAD